MLNAIKFLPAVNGLLLTPLSFEKLLMVNVQHRQILILRCPAIDICNIQVTTNI
jgi:hypothetical protein